MVNKRLFFLVLMLCIYTALSYSFDYRFGNRAMNSSMEADFTYNFHDKKFLLNIIPQISEHKYDTTTVYGAACKQQQHINFGGYAVIPVAWSKGFHPSITVHTSYK